MGSVPRVFVAGLGRLSALRSAIAMAPALLFHPNLSEWHIVSDESVAVSAGLGIDLATGFFKMNLANYRTSEVITLMGKGGGGGLSAGLMPASVNLDPGLLVPKTPSLGSLTAALRNVAAMLGRANRNSPIYLLPGRTDGAQLFAGFAQIITLSAAAFVEASSSVIVFHHLNGDLKAFAFLTGIDFVSDVSLAVGDIVYSVTMDPANICWAG